MRKLTHLVLAVAMTASVVGAASAAEHHHHRSNSQNFAGTWYYPWIGPTWGQGGFQEWGTPYVGSSFAKDYSGEVVYVDDLRLGLKADGSGDILNFYIYAGNTRFTPSMAAVREGSKVKVRSDDRRRARVVEIVPFYKWLKGRTK